MVCVRDDAAAFRPFNVPFPGWEAEGPALDGKSAAIRALPMKSSPRTLDERTETSASERTQRCPEAIDQAALELLLAFALVASSASGASFVKVH